MRFCSSRSVEAANVGAVMAGLFDCVWAKMCPVLDCSGTVAH